MLSFLAAASLAACSSQVPTAADLPHASKGPAKVVPGQAPVVWVSGQSDRVSGSRLTVVTGGGALTVIHRLAEGATRFFVWKDGRYERLDEADAGLIEVGTPLCVESLLDGRTLLALRVFLGAACGPRR